MPNWVLSNINIKGSGPDLQKFLDRFREPDGDIKFKFNKIIPMPKGLITNEGPYSETGAIYIWLTEHPGELPPAGLLNAECRNESFAARCDESKAEFESADKATQQEMIEGGRRGLDNCIKYGAISWYDWCMNNWGVKSDVNDKAYVQGPLNPNAGEDSVVLRFLTAWSFPAPIFVELSKLYPKLTFESKYADQDYGFNCAEFKAKNGEVEFNDRDGDRVFACNVWGMESKPCKVNKNMEKTETAD